MIQVNGYAAKKAKASLAPYAFERREPGEFDIVIDISYCGICHTDIHQVGDEWGGSTFPMVPGHEITGIVSQVGPKVTRYKAGDRVGVGCFVNSCRNFLHLFQYVRCHNFAFVLFIFYNEFQIY